MLYGFLLKMVLALAVFSCSGCTTKGTEPELVPVVSEDSSIGSAIQLWSHSMLHKDLNGIMAAYSERYRHVELGGKAEERAYLEEALIAGNLDDLRIDTSQVRVHMQGNEAVVSPILLASPPGGFGAVAFTLRLHREDSGWKITERISSEL